jgi:hypothetical protein
MISLWRCIGKKYKMECCMEKEERREEERQEKRHLAVFPDQCNSILPKGGIKYMNVYFLSIC